MRKYTGGCYKETTSEQWSIALGIKKGKKTVFGGEYSYARSILGLPDTEYYGPYYRQEYTEWGLPITVEEYKPESNRHYLKRKGAPWEHDWQWQLVPGVGGMSETLAKKLKVEGNADDWKLKIGGSYIIIKGNVGINLTELYDFIAKSFGYEGVKP